MLINAVPASRSTLRTSAKSTLTSPGTLITSAIPCTPWRRTSSASLKASVRPRSRPLTESSRSFGTVISASISALNAARPSSAMCLRRDPSNANGSVIIPMVSAPIFLAIEPTTGAPPVPVPPPIPAAMNTRSAPSKAARISSVLSVAARAPTVALPPAPRPFV